jgi:hypothetical protein
MLKKERKLSMNRSLVAQICNLLYRRIAFCGRHNPSMGSWLSMNRGSSLVLSLDPSLCLRFSDFQFQPAYQVMKEQ